MFDSRDSQQNIIKDYCLLAALEYITNLWKENVNMRVRIPLIVQRDFNGVIVQLIRIPDCRSGGREFEPRYSLELNDF